MPHPHLPTILAGLRKEQRTLAMLAAGAALVAGFIKLAEEVGEGETGAIDRAILTGLRQPGDLATPIGPSWLEGSMIDLTALGGTTVLTLVSVLAIAFLLVRGRWRQAVFAAIATGGGAIMGKTLKALFARERPEIVPHLIEVTSLSFPSGHSTNSAIVYLTLAAMLAASFQERAARYFVVGAAAMLVLLIGITRVYLGVHYPSDVLGGWTLGAAWALAMGLIASLLQRKRTIELPGETPD